MSRNRSRIHGDFGNPGDRRSGRVGRRDRVTPRCRQLHSEGVPTTISGGEWIVCGERCGAIGTGQCHRARVTFGDVPVGIQRQHRDRGIRTGRGGRTAEDAELGSNATDFRCGTRITERPRSRERRSRIKQERRSIRHNTMAKRFQVRAERRREC